MDRSSTDTPTRRGGEESGTPGNERRTGARRQRNHVVTGGVLVVALVVSMVLLLAAPVVGAVVSTALFVACVPWGRSTSGRIVRVVLLACGLMALALASGETFGVRVLSPDKVTLMAAVPGVLGAIVGLSFVVRGSRVPLPRLDAGTVPLLALPLVGWWATASHAMGPTLGQEIGGLMAMGWDHQSHFSIFAYLFEQGGVWRSGPMESGSMFIGYPPLAGALGVAMAMLSGAEGPAMALLDPYTQTAGVLFGISAGLLGWVAASMARRVAGPVHSGGLQFICGTAGLVVGGYVLLGPPFAFFDYGFTNFLFAVSLAVAGSWVAATSRNKAPLSAALIAVSATTALSLLWTPLVLLMVPVGVLVIVSMVRQQRWLALGGAAGVAVVGAGVAAWQTFRIAPDGTQAASLAQTLAGIGGGQPAAPLPHLVGLTALLLTAMVVAGGARSRYWAAASLPVWAAALISAGFVWNTARFGLSPGDSYYVAKSLWTVYLCLVPVIGGGVGYALSALAGHLAPGRNRAHALRGGGTMLLGATTAAALVWSSAPSPNAPNGSIDYYSIPVGGQAVLDRESLFSSVPQGDVVAHAAMRTADRPRRLAIVWDSGDLLTNRWLASLRGNLTGGADRVLSSLLSAPYGEPAAVALRQALVEDPTLRVVVTWSNPASRDLLRPLRNEFGDRVVMRRM